MGLGLGQGWVCMPCMPRTRAAEYVVVACAPVEVLALREDVPLRTGRARLGRLRLVVRVGVILSRLMVRVTGLGLGLG